MDYRRGTRNSQAALGMNRNKRPVRTARVVFLMNVTLGTRVKLTDGEVSAHWESSLMIAAPSPHLAALFLILLVLLSGVSHFCLGDCSGAFHTCPWIRGKQQASLTTPKVSLSFYRSQQMTGGHVQPSSLLLSIQSSIHSICIAATFHR